MKSILTHTTISFILVFVLAVPHANSQLRLNQFYVTAYPHFPIVKILCTIECNGWTNTTASKNNFRIHENGKEIRDFELGHYYDPFCVTASFVFAGSWEMNSGTPSGIVVAKQIARAYLDSMNAACNEGQVFSYSGNDLTSTKMTNDQRLLREAIDQVVVGKNRKIWDAVDSAVNRLYDEAFPSCRVIYLFSDGNDSGSTHSLADVISNALSKQIGITTIGIGSVLNEGDLQQLAGDTFGIYLPMDFIASRDLSDITCLTVISEHTHWINYRTACQGDTIRKVELTVSGIAGCSDSVTKSKIFFIQPEWRSTNTVDLALGIDTIRSGYESIIPIVLQTKIEQEFSNVSFRVFYDTASLEFVRFDKANEWQSTRQIAWMRIPGGIECTSIFPLARIQTDTLTRLRFRLKQSLPGQVHVITLRDWTFASGCLNARSHDGKIIISAPLDVESYDRLFLSDFELTQNYPNPFSESTTIEFKITDFRLQISDRPPLEETDVRNPQSVNLKFYDLFGREVLDLSDEARSHSSVTIHASQLPGAGMYFYRLSIGSQTMTRIMIRR